MLLRGRLLVTHIYRLPTLASPPFGFPTATMATTATRSSKRQKTSTQDQQPYELIYWPGIPGRGEHIRLAFEETNTPYNDICNASDDGIKAVMSQISDKNHGDGGNPPPLAPPILRHGDLLLSQTPSILLYLGPKLGLIPNLHDNAASVYHVNALTLTALDGLSNETHDTHHPVAVMKHYEEQKDEAKLKANDYIGTRLPKFLGYFERVLKSESSGGGEWLYGGSLSYADLVLFQCLDGNLHAFPKALAKLKKSGKYDGVFALYERVKSRPSLSKYLESEKRLKYSMGIYRHYPELDVE